MRIKKDKPQNIGIIGKIKVGEKRKNSKGKEYPVSLDYFKASSDLKMIEDSFNSQYHKADALPVCFVTDDDDFNTDNRFEIRDKSGKLYSYGDGHDFYVSRAQGWHLVSNKDILDKYVSVETFKAKTANYLSSQDFQANWKESLTLRFVVPGIHVLGVWQLRTQASRSSIDQILSSYDMIKQINGGTVQMVPFLLSVKKVKSARVLNGARVYPVISLTPLMPEQAKNNLIDSNLMPSDTKMIE